MSSIYKTSSLLTRPISLDKILTSIVEETARVFGFTRVAIFLLNEDRTLLECKYLIGFNSKEKERARRLPFYMDRHDCIETLAAKTGKEIFIKDHLQDSRITKIDLKISRIQNRISTIAIPLKIKRDIKR